MAEPRIEVRRSRRRTRTVSAYRDGETVIVLIPASMNETEEKHWVSEMLSRLERSEKRKRSPARNSDAELAARCRQLAARYLDPALKPDVVRWVAPMRTRWASCTPGERSIRVSNRLQQVPAWVLDYVLIHELAHLKVPGHGPDFWAMVSNYPKTERAMGYLEGLSAAANLGIDTEPDQGAVADSSDELSENDLR